MHSTEQLATLIWRKHQVLVQLCKLGRRQEDLIASGETALLLRLLAAKQSLIAALQETERDLAPYHGEDPEQRKWATPDARAKCATLADECNAMLRDIVAIEQQGADTMTARRNEIANQLQRVHTATQVRGAYESQRRPKTSIRG